VQYLIEVVKVDAEAAEWNKNKRPIHMATEKGYLHIVQYLIEKAAVDKEAVARNQSRPIHLAIRKGHLAIADYLVRKARVNAEAAYKYGDTPIHLAVEYGYLPLVQCLIEEAKAKQEVTDSWGYRPLHTAVLHNRLDIVRYLIENVKVDKEAETENKDRAIHVVNGNLSMLQYLIEKAKVEAQACNLYRYTPLHYAARDGHLALVQYLIERAQVDPTSLNHKGETPLDLAVKQNHQEVIAYLEETTKFSAKVLTVENATNVVEQYLKEVQLATMGGKFRNLGYEVRGKELLERIEDLKKVEKKGFRIEGEKLMATNVKKEEEAIEEKMKKHKETIDALRALRKQLREATKTEPDGYSSNEELDLSRAEGGNWIPGSIILDNGQVVKIEFGTSDDGKSANNLVHTKLIKALKALLNRVSQHMEVQVIFIKTTTNGKHGKKSNHKVHQKARAIDISRINGQFVEALGQEPKQEMIKLWQDIIDSLPDTRENFGPCFLHKKEVGKEAEVYIHSDPIEHEKLVKNHKDHIHFAVN
jgi:ankyrin repeat protein